ncbi:sensor domain-containing diguanylate cyclase [Pseudidiomarina sp. 1APR75-33.1]|uniref:sensor domain-containing diguanylate cyclase n=1 Tax=Pseudidiomarina terrestris TaxID=2820060 RepID=UPI00264E64B7|nr:sensor domain-containing diguanylate cyclase [Pseudidiomarina sp. 1APR75-33.1]MDN7128244.1 sensor domain-containing diguanylate cyclase [Pseudidiomarina sp. 1APR75-33.1]
MQKPPIPENETERLHALRMLQILDTSHEERFDRVTRMAKRIFGVDISLVSLVDQDRQWFKSKQGLEVDETPRDISFCGHAINEDGLFIVPNAVEDERFHDNPLVTSGPQIRFYAGYPLKLRQGVNVGTLCLIDSKPREMNAEDQQLLADLGAMIEQEVKSIQLATLDELTLISNRRGFLTLADHSLKMCKRHNVPFTFVFFDLNKFKAINDDYGHHEGDYVLKTFARLMLDTFRESDIVARLGGDEFIVMLSDAKEDKVEKALERLAKAVEQENKSNDKPYTIEYSAGIASFEPETEIAIEDMIKRADAAMYEQKGSRSR